jgi:hypothetical protein
MKQIVSVGCIHRIKLFWPAQIARNSDRSRHADLTHGITAV